MTYYDRLNYFYKFIKAHKLKPSSQLLYLHLLQINNELRQIDSFYVSDRALAELTGLSLRVISESKSVLKNFGLLDFKTVNHRTKYFFSNNLPSETQSETLAETKSGQNSQVRPFSSVPTNNNLKERIEQTREGRELRQQVPDALATRKLLDELDEKKKQAFESRSQETKDFLKSVMARLNLKTID